MLVNKYCNSIKIKLAFSSFKVKNLISVKDYVPRSLRSYVVYKFKCAGCNSVYIGETSRHLSTRVREHLFTDKIQIFLNILKVQLVVKRHVTIVVLKCWILQTLLLNLKLKKRYIFNGKDLI